MSDTFFSDPGIIGIIGIIAGLVIFVFCICIWTLINNDCCITNDDYDSIDEYDNIQENRLEGEIIIIPVNLENICAVCLEEFDRDSISRVLDCGHYYHQVCIDEWLQRNRNCPKCGNY